MAESLRPAFSLTLQPVKEPHRDASSTFSPPLPSFLFSASNLRPATHHRAYPEKMLRQPTSCFFFPSFRGNSSNEFACRVRKLRGFFFSPFPFFFFPNLLFASRSETAWHEAPRNTPGSLLFSFSPKLPDAVSQSFSPPPFFSLPLLDFSEGVKVR